MGQPFNQQSVIQAMASKSVKTQLIQQTEPLESGQEESIYIYSSPGTIGRLKSLDINVFAPIGATTGQHSGQVLDENLQVSYLLGETAFSDWLYFAYGEWIFATVKKHPTTPEAQGNQMASVRMTDTYGMVIYYRNNTDVVQTIARKFAVVLEEEKVV